MLAYKAAYLRVIDEVLANTLAVKLVELLIVSKML